MIQGKLEEALDHCSTALVLDTNHRQAHYNMNVLLRRLNRQQEAIDVYWKKIEADVGFSIQPHYSTNQSTEMELSHAQMDLVTVICVKWGTKYDAEYVNKLYRALLRHSGKISFRFICLTEDPSDLSDEIKTFPLEQGWSEPVDLPLLLSQTKHNWSLAAVDVDVDSVFQISNLTEGGSPLSSSFCSQ